MLKADFKWRAKSAGNSPEVKPRDLAGRGAVRAVWVLCRVPLAYRKKYWKIHCTQ